MTFEPAETIFTRRDMPPHVREIKEQTNIFVDPDILERRKPWWNASVDASKQSDKEITTLKAAMHKVQ